MLQLFKLETEARRGRSPAAGLQEYNTHMRENELEQEIRRLKQVRNFLQSKLFSVISCILSVTY